MKNLIVSAVSAIKDLSTTFSAPKAPHRTTEQLIDLVVACVNTWTEHGNLTLQIRFPDRQSYWGDLTGNLERMGFKVLGNGFFSFALAHPELPQRVLKVGLKKEDSAAAYIAWCRMNKGRVGVPNVYTTKRSTGCYVVEMDHLLPINTDKLEEFTAWSAARSGLFGLPMPKRAPELIALYETAKSIREFFDGLARFDLHAENVMVDIHGNVIITDPVSYSEDEESLKADDSWSFLDDGEHLNTVRTSAKARKESREAAERARNEARVEVRNAQLRDWFMDEWQLKELKDARMMDCLKPRGQRRTAKFVGELRAKHFRAWRLANPKLDADFAKLEERIVEKLPPDEGPLVGALRGVADRDGNIVTDLDKELDARFRG